MSRKIYFVRHGSPIRLPEQFIGRIDSPLTEEGKEEALRTGKWLSSNHFSGVVYSSPLSRAYDTAQIIVNEINKEKIIIKSDIKIIDELTECDFGLFDGMSMNEFQNKYPNECKSWLDNPFINSFPEGESFIECGKRFAKAIDLILENNKDNNEDILVTAHMCSIQSYFIVKGLKTFGIDFVEKPLACASITSAIYDNQNNITIEKWGFIPNQEN